MVIEIECENICKHCGSKQHHGYLDGAICDKDGSLQVVCGMCGKDILSFPKIKIGDSITVKNLTKATYHNHSGTVELCTR